jgi:hypothetical protein
VWVAAADPGAFLIEQKMLRRIRWTLPSGRSSLHHFDVVGLARKDEWDPAAIEAVAGTFDL